MKFHKANFPIQTIIKDKKIMIVSGWIDETNFYGFYKSGKTWKATDIVSGTLITVQPTRKACVEWIEENLVRIEEAKKTQKYRIKVDDFKLLIKEALSNI